ncbi:GspE/PulE family protein [Pasteurella sp. P03HT]
MMSARISITTQEGDVITVCPQLWQKNQQKQHILLRYFAVPLKEDEKTLWLGVDSLANVSACELFAFLSSKFVEPVLLDVDELKTALQRLVPSLLQIEDMTQVSYHSPTVEEDISLDDPIIQLLNQIFESARQKNASDIHIEPQSHVLQLRFRIDGVLQVQPHLALSLSSRLLSRLKLLAKLDISETRLPQDGRFQFKTPFSDVLDFRLATLATHWGEKAVLRLQQNQPIHADFTTLGMTSHQHQYFESILTQPQGLILVTGPTGSGKSISLYTALNWLNKTDKHILTAEDPIEIELEGIIQTQVNSSIGLDFCRLLRAFLRQDPDIIMLGEIRDEETAAIALRAAQTGHLVLSTLHTNDAQSALSRLQQLGVQPHEIEHSLLLVVAQRLVRQLCSKCGGKTTIGCECYQGYSGRIGVYQFLQKDAVGQFTLDYSTLYESAMEKVRLGMTNEQEVRRVLGDVCLN